MWTRAVAARLLLLSVALGALACSSSSPSKPGPGAGGKGGTSGGTAGAGAAGATGNGGSGSGAAGTTGAAGTMGAAGVTGGGGSSVAGNGAAGAGAAGVGAAGVGAAGSSAAGSGAAGSGAGPDPYGPSPAAEAPLARGSWVDRTPCRYLPSVPDGQQLTHDASGRLFMYAGGQGSSGPEMNLFEWDHTARHFWNRTPCKVESTWPVVNFLGGFGYDPGTDTLVVMGDSETDPSVPTTWRRAPAAGTWTRTPGNFLFGFFSRGTFTRDVKRKSLLFVHEGLAELVDGASSWTNVFQVGTPTMSPPVQRDNRQVYDPTRETLVRFVFNSATGDPIQTWEYSLTTHDWLNRTPAQAPSGLTEVHGWWNPVSQRASLIAFPIEGQPGGIFVWEWNAVAGSWSQIAAAAGSPAGPVGVAVQSLSFDVMRGRLVLHTQAGPNPALWAWTVATRTWTRLSPERWATLWPGSLSGGVVYDVVRRRTVLVSVAADKSTELLEWDGTAAKFDDLQTAGASPWPPPLDGMAVAYDGHRQRTLLYGAGSNTFERVLWEWDGAAKRWTDRSNAGTALAPPSLSRPSMAYDTKRRRLVVLGLGNGLQLWEWDGVAGTWQERTVPANVRTLFGTLGPLAVYDESRGRTVFAVSPPYLAEWDGTTWTVPTLADVQTTGRTVAAYDARRARTMFLSVGAPKVLLSWDGQRLVNETPAGLAAANYEGNTFDVGMVYDRRRGNLMLLGQEGPPALNGFSRSGLIVWEGSTTP